MQWLIDNIVPSLVVAAILSVVGIIGFRHRLSALWDRRPWPKIRRAPRTPAETRRVLAVRPPGWEFMHFAGELYQRLEAAEPRYRDHEARYVRPSAMVVPEEGFGDYVSGELDAVQTIVSNWSSLINGAALGRAFGEPGQSGDPRRIEHVTERLTSAYVELMDWSDRLLGARRPSRYRRLINIIARFADQPIQQYRDWVEEIVKVTDHKAELMSRGEPLGDQIEISLTLQLADDVQREFDAEIAAIHRGERDNPDEPDDDSADTRQLNA